MKDIGYYAGFLSADDCDEINGATRNQLLDLLSDLAINLSSEAPTRSLQIDDFWLSTNSDSDHNKLALIRGLCDRIEFKLMEAAK